MERDPHPNVSKEKLEFEALIFDVGGVVVSHDDDMLHRLLAERCAVPSALEGTRSVLQDVRINTGEMPVTECIATFAQARL